MSRLIHAGIHTEYCGPGRVWFVSFFGGAGYQLPLVRGRGWDGKPLNARHWPNVRIPGFTLFVRLTESRRQEAWPATGGGFTRAVNRLRLTRDPNQPVV